MTGLANEPRVAEVSPLPTVKVVPFRPGKNRAVIADHVDSPAARAATAETRQGLAVALLDRVSNGSSWNKRRDARIHFGDLRLDALEDRSNLCSDRFPDSMGYAFFAIGITSAPSRSASR